MSAERDALSEAMPWPSEILDAIYQAHSSLPVPLPKGSHILTYGKRVSVVALRTLNDTVHVLTDQGDWTVIRAAGRLVIGPMNAGRQA
jgi:hypothetical protein